MGLLRFDPMNLRLKTSITHNPVDFKKTDIIFDMTNLLGYTMQKTFIGLSYCFRAIIRMSFESTFDSCIFIGLFCVL
jgi:hypothetical protein